MSHQPGKLRIGTSGFQYDHWKNIFYPNGMPQSKWFEHYASYFDTVELNVTFYRLPSHKAFVSWRERAPESFLFAVKFSQYGTHRKRLKEAEETISAFLDYATDLQQTLGPILVQLPPHWKADPKRLEQFLAKAPQQHDWAVEVRDSSWLCEEVFQVLQQYNAALCIHDKVPEHPWRLTTDWTYLRYHGPDGGSREKYTSQKLVADARRIAELQSDGIDVYVYFNNDLKGFAIEDALALWRYIENAK